ncbi:hypothetical protein OGATHE_001089 [Ogataea polymorpha]|uniref:Uncharacterized protein n=1 Tax=Ogataea polymorpha TaxID=460523 RepID=A0A9P8PS00_9ASCO|nr:hypothetical protein OGATHE_001089 [Ogataea polymorpha]
MAAPALTLGQILLEFFPTAAKPAFKIDQGTIDLRCLEQESSSTGNGSQTSSTNLSTSVLSSGDDWSRGSSSRGSSRRNWASGDSGGGNDLLLGAWAVGDGQGGGTGDGVSLSVGDNRGWLWAVGSQSSDNLRNSGLVSNGRDGAVRVSSESSGSQSKWRQSSELHF